MADRRQHSALTKLGFGALAFNSALAVYKSWGDTGSVAFVLAADAALVLLVLCLREFEQPRGGPARGRNIKAAVWALTTLLTAMFASRVAPPLVPTAALLLLVLCLREFERAGGRDRIGIGAQYSALARMGFAVLACNSALAIHDARAGAGSLAFVLLTYAALLVLTWLFLRSVILTGLFVRANH
ncbi:hypothetical protein BAE44_0000057 [Dichanthelium oligosanthes]|uniref:Uncharacterized protein n=1 Tax=Dichanthelium oligosanthes TaxID=888268 RepID=A0A1E5WNF8_9POAL|nr:hypothetical protein BAE44_0000057 [Dichanthelium oligosanthes]